MRNFSCEVTGILETRRKKEAAILTNFTHCIRPFVLYLPIAISYYYYYQAYWVIKSENLPKNAASFFIMFQGHNYHVCTEFHAFCHKCAKSLKKNRISKNWLTKQHRDYFVRQSKIQGYRSRSAFKLIEINEKFNFLQKNTLLLELMLSPQQQLTEGIWKFHLFFLKFS